MRIVKLTPREELKNLFVETLLNHTDAVTKVSNNSVLSGIAYGAASVGQKALVEVAAVESHLFPDSASGSQLDTIASNYGIAPRFTTSGSSTYLRVTATPGTTYTSGTHTFTGSHGIVFNIAENVTVGVLGYAYIKVNSATSGEDTNVNALTITTVSPIPAGHQNAVNEYAATGGRSLETDDLFKKRIKEGVNILARGTISSIEQAFMKVNQNVLKVFNHGLDSLGNIKLVIVTQNGASLTNNELQALLDVSGEFMSLSTLRPYGSGNYGITLSNVDFEPIDINFRVTLESGYNPDTYRIDLQSKISKYLDPRTFDPEVDKVEWDDILSFAKNTKGAKYIPDQYFFLNSGRVDVSIPRNKVARPRSFAMYDGSGVLIQNLSGTLSPIYFPSQPELNYQLTALKTL